MGQKIDNSSPHGCAMSSCVAMFAGILFLVCVVGVGVTVYFATIEIVDCGCPDDRVVDKMVGDKKSEDDKKGKDTILVSTHWLSTKIYEASRTGDATIRVVEVSMGAPGDEELFYEGHIPNAVYTTVKSCANATALFPVDLPDPECFGEHIRSLGISEDTHVVVYDRLDIRPSSREWWILKLHGHKGVSILDGGLAKWISDGYETSNKNLTTLTTDYSLTFVPAKIRHMDAMMYNMKTRAEQIADARNGEVYNGSISDRGLKKGHIPGAKNIPLSYLFEDDRTFKSPEDLRKLAESRGLDLERPVVTMCRTGMQASVLSVALHLTGIGNVPVYYGSWSQWSQLVDDEYIAIGSS
ncbi:hypothetical protein ScPMuIL_013850 [Solemya velum]